MILQFSIIIIEGKQENWETILFRYAFILLLGYFVPFYQTTRIIIIPLIHEDSCFKQFTEWQIIQKKSEKWRASRPSKKNTVVFIFPLTRRVPHSDYIPLSFDEHGWLPSTRQSAITGLVRPVQCLDSIARSILHYNRSGNFNQFSDRV